MSPVLDFAQMRQFAVEVVGRLRAKGYEALWAGGCVRDQLLGLKPKDYDVATSARPEQIREVFGHKRTLPIGAAFGVISVLGPKEAGHIEVATFRRDEEYLDGRHPSGVTFTNAEEDAKRRDFTINGIFYDPLLEKVIDYVGGQQDLENKLVRAIGDPRQRFAEDKLRMLRAVRFTATFDFALDSETLSAIQQQADELTVVSVERIASELRRMLVHPHRKRAMELLRGARLLEVVLPEVASQAVSASEEAPQHTWENKLAILDRLREPTFSVALAAVLRDLSHPDEPRLELARQICWGLSLSNEESDGVQKLLREEPLIRSAEALPWPRLQRILVAPRIAELLEYAEAVAAVLDGTTAAVDHCRQLLLLPTDQLDAPPLINGDDLKRAGIPPGPKYKVILESVRDAQLEGKITSCEAALALARQLAE
ncbi:MAG TPA: CCA tRNA nucleotidyltransferase [Pirellulaceae bacterium]|nr:CCA tRNA nucleotidyltransferase [Pirellulaceae bacterium]